MKKLFVVVVVVLWSPSLLAKLVGFAKGRVATEYDVKISLRAMGLSNHLSLPICANSSLCASLFSPETNGLISYCLTARDGSWQQVFSVELSEQTDSVGRYMVYRRYEQDGRATRVKLEGDFQYYNEQKAVLSYKELDNSWINIIFFKPPSENESWALGVRTTVRGNRHRLLLDIQDEMKHDETAE